MLRKISTISLRVYASVHLVVFPYTQRERDGLAVLTCDCSLQAKKICSSAIRQEESLVIAFSGCGFSPAQIQYKLVN